MFYASSKSMGPFSNEKGKFPVFLRKDSIAYESLGLEAGPGSYGTFVADFLKAGP